MRLIIPLIFATALLCRAEKPAEGRWEGTIKIPERELKLIVDLALDRSGAWIGSITLPGMSVKGSALADIALKDSELSFSIQSALGAKQDGPITFKGHLSGGDSCAGDFVQGGNTALFSMKKSGPAEVEVLPKSTAIAKEIEGEWQGGYELLGYPRKVTMKLSNRPNDGATAEWVIVGRKTNNLPVDLVTQAGDLLTIDSHETGLSYEGRFKDNEINGTLTQGPLEIPVVMKRAK